MNSEIEEYKNIDSPQIDVFIHKFPIILQI